ncbi:MAG: hypothetical protein FWG65_07745 [Turicibacter sp.]|nr:hypothetical protein [Turicibacter sp.]
MIIANGVIKSITKRSGEDLHDNVYENGVTFEVLRGLVGEQFKGTSIQIMLKINDPPKIEFNNKTFAIDESLYVECYHHMENFYPNNRIDNEQMRELEENFLDKEVQIAIVPISETKHRLAGRYTNFWELHALEMAVKILPPKPYEVVIEENGKLKEDSSPFVVGKLPILAGISDNVRFTINADNGGAVQYFAELIELKKQCGIYEIWAKEHIKGLKKAGFDEKFLKTAGFDDASIQAAFY